MKTLLNKIILSGNVPYVGIAITFACGLAIGYDQAKTEPVRFAIAERGAVILDAVLDRPTASKEAIEKEVTAPIIAVLQEYKDKGYVVLDAVQNESGGYEVSALPDNTINITGLLRKAVIPATTAPDVAAAAK
jgi:hypothetical protein